MRLMTLVFIAGSTVVSLADDAKVATTPEPAKTAQSSKKKATKGAQKSAQKNEGGTVTEGSEYNKDGVTIKELKLGTGKDAKAGMTAIVHYTGTLASNGKKFDSSRDRNEPFSFALGRGQVIKGWDIGVEGMKVGGKRLLTIPADKAYGDRDVGGGLIPAKSTLVFDVELIDVR